MDEQAVSSIRVVATWDGWLRLAVPRLFAPLRTVRSSQAAWAAKSGGWVFGFLTTAPMGVSHDQDPDFVEAVARRVAELLEARADADDEASEDLLTVAQVARRYRVRPSWVYAHQRELGAIRLGTGPKARLRFHAALLPLKAPSARAAPVSTEPRPRRRRLQPSMKPPELRYDH